MAFFAFKLRAAGLGAGCIAGRGAGAFTGCGVLVWDAGCAGAGELVFTRAAASWASLALRVAAAWRCFGDALRGAAGGVLGGAGGCLGALAAGCGLADVWVGRGAPNLGLGVDGTGGFAAVGVTTWLTLATSASGSGTAVWLPDVPAPALGEPALSWLLGSSSTSASSDKRMVRAREPAREPTRAVGAAGSAGAGFFGAATSDLRCATMARCTTDMRGRGGARPCFAIRASMLCWRATSRSSAVIDSSVSLVAGLASRTGVDASLVLPLLDSCAGLARGCFAVVAGFRTVALLLRLNDAAAAAARARLPRTVRSAAANCCMKLCSCLNTVSGSAPGSPSQAAARSAASFALASARLQL